MTVLEAYHQSAQSLLGSIPGLSREEACAQARILIDFLTGQRYAHLLQPEAELTDEPALRKLLGELVDGRPLPYVIGRREFYGLSFRCDERALIPRPETELLVETTVARLKGRGPTTVADLGTGTGCIAVSIAHALPTATIFASDASSGALALARENATEHGVEDRVRFLTGEEIDWCGPLRRLGMEFDAILSNPPYIAAVDIEDLQTSVRDWEPRTALDGGPDGLDDYRLIAAQCQGVLKHDGYLAVELGAGQFEAVRDIFKVSDWQVEEPLFDFAGIARMLVARRHL